jgi:hypothetical protein
MMKGLRDGLKQGEILLTIYLVISNYDEPQALITPASFNNR